MRRILVLALLLVILGGTLAAGACRGGPSKAAIDAARIEQVRGNLYMITGSGLENPSTFSGGNVGVFVTENGVVIVDTKVPGYGQVILDRIKTVTDKPVTMIINTHTHDDHTGSNAMFPASVDIVAHENTKANMAKMTLFKGDGEKHLPKRTYTDTMTIGSGKDRIDLYYFGRAHTNGDTWIVFPALRVMHTGDMFAWKDAPYLDLENGGSGLEYAKTVGRALDTVKDVDTLVVGHSPLRTVPELREYQQFMIDFVAAVQAAKTAGKSVKDATREIDLSSKYQGYKKDLYGDAVQAIYSELK